MTQNKANDFLGRILLVADGSTSSDEAARFAFRLAAKAAAKVVAAYPVDTATMDYLLQMHIFVEDEREDFEEALVLKGNSYLARMLEMGQQFHVETECVMCKGRFHLSLLETAHKHHCDLIVIGTWHNASQAHDNFSNERELLVQLADCAVTVVKMPRKI